MDALKDIFIQLKNGTPEMTLCVAMIVLGYGLKAASWFPNKVIPLICILVSSAAYPFIVDISGSAPYQMRNPVIRQMMIGAVIGFVAWTVHRAFLKKWLDKILPKNGDTEHYAIKPDENPRLPPPA